MRGNAHVRFGRRTGETGRWKQQYGALVRSHDAAMVLCVDDKSQIQALDHTSLVLALLPGTPEQRTHDTGLAPAGTLGTKDPEITNARPLGPVRSPGPARTLTARAIT